MATIADVTFSMYSVVKKFADTINFGFVSTTSIEAADAAMIAGEDRLVLVQTRLEDKVFLDIEYKIFISFAKSTDINSIKETEITAALVDLFPAFSKVCIYKAEDLKKVPSEYTDTGASMVVKSIGQDIVSITQMRNNLSCVVVKLAGYIK
jgi:hypothetical protein